MYWEGEPAGDPAVHFRHVLSHLEVGGPAMVCCAGCGR